MYRQVALNLRVERLPAPEALADIAAEWEELDRQIEPRTPFTSPAWIMSWWKHFSRRPRAFFHDEFFGHVVRDGDGCLVAVAPLIRTTPIGIASPLLRMIQFFGTDPALTEIRGVICRPEDQVPVVDALAKHFLARRREWDVFRWKGLRKADNADGSLRLPGRFELEGGLPDYIIDLPESWDALRHQVSSNMRKNLRKAYEFLERDGLSLTLRITERPDDVPAALSRFLALHAARADAADMIEHPNKFAQPHARAFVSEYLQLAAERGGMKIFELEIGGVVVASRLTFLIDSDLYMYFAGYDPAWKAYSVMTVLMAEIFKWAFAHGIERINLSTGCDQSKVRWKPREVLFWDALQVSPTRRARAAMSVFRAYEALSRARRHLPARNAFRLDAPGWLAHLRPEQGSQTEALVPIRTGTQRH
jgi:CelD/BcsL family acetyltransferase involved in cellulose biosynthesis